MRTAPALLAALALAIPAAAGPPRADPDGFPLPPEVLHRLGSARFRHPHPILTFSFRPDGKVVYTTDGHSVYGWDLATGHRTFITPGAGDHARWGGLGSTATRLRAVATEYGGHVVTDLDPQTGKVIGRAKPVHAGQDGSVALSPDGEWLLHFVPPTADERAKTPGKSWGRVRVSDAAGARPAADLGQVNSSSFARFARNGTVFAVTGWEADGPIRAFDPRTGKVLREWARGGEHLQYSNASDHAFTAWSLKPGELALKAWDAKTGKVHTLFSGYEHAAIHATAPGDGVLAVQAAPDWHDWLFTDLATGKPLGRLPLAAYPFRTHGEFVPGGKTFVTQAGYGAGDRSHVITPWEVATGRPTVAATYPSEAVTRLRAVADGRLLAAADGRVFDWDAGTGAARRHGTVLDREGWVSSDAWDVRADGVRVARTKRVHYPDTHTRVTIADAATGEVRATVGAPLPGGVTVLAFSADGGRLFWADPNERAVMEWDLAADRVVARRKAAGVARQLRTSPDGHWLVGLTSPWGSDDEPCQATVWDLRAADRPRVIDCAGESWVRTEFGGRGDLTILGCTATAFNLRTWDLTAGREVWRASAPLQPGFRPGAPVVLSPDGGTLAIPVVPPGSSGYVVQLIELFTGQPRHSFVGHTAPVTALAFTGDGRLASAGQDAPVYLWDVRGELTRPTDPPDRTALEGAWADLGSENPAVGFRAVRLLAAFPERSVPFLSGRLAPAADPDPVQFAALVAGLDASRFADRERATRELAGLGRPAEPGLRKALASTGSAEVRSRLEGLLARFPKEKLGPDELRAARAVEAVGWAGTPAARALLARWAGGAAGFPLTTVAARATGRLPQ